MQRILIHRSFADRTEPYLSLPTLKGWLRQKRLDARVLDLNVEAIHWLLRPDVLRARAESMGSRFLALNAEAVVVTNERHAKDLAAEKSKLNIAAFLHTPIKVTDFFRLVGRMRARKLEAEAKK